MPSKAEALRALAVRRMHDPVWWFFHKDHHPHSENQKAILKAPERFKAIKAGNRAGKSAIMGLDLAATLRNIHPYRPKPKRPVRILFMIMSRKQGVAVWKNKLLVNCELRGEHVPETIRRSPMIPGSWKGGREIKHVGWDYSPGGSVPVHIEMQNGNQLYMAWSNTDRQKDLIQGIAFDAVYIDEGACSIEMLNEIYGRLTEAIGDPDIPGFGSILWPATATSIEYEGYYDFLQKCADPDFPEWACYELNREENPAISGEASSITERAWGQEEANIRKRGGTAQERYSVYGDHFKSQIHVLPDDYKPGLYDSIYITYDPGVANKCGLGFWGFTKAHPETAHLWKWYELSNTTVSEEAELIAHVLEGRFIEAVIMDPAGKKRQKGADGFVSVLGLLHDELAKRGISVASGTIKQSTDGGFLTTRADVDEMGSINGHAAGIKDCRRALEEGRLKISPSAESGGRLAIQRLLNYQFKPGTMFRGIGTVKAKNSEFPDCLTEDAMVTTARGEVSIASVSVGDLVWTRGGWREVADAWLAREDAEVHELVLSSGRVLAGTPDHRVFLSDGSCRTIEQIAVGDALWDMSSSMGINTGSTTERAPGITVDPAGACSTGTSGSITTARSRQSTTSTMSTATGATTTSVTSSASLGEITPSCTGDLPHHRPWRRQPSGTGARMAASGLPATPAPCGQDDSPSSTCAISAALATEPHPGAMSDSAPTHARPAGELSPESTTSPAIAPTAESRSCAIATGASDTAPVIVVEKRVRPGRHKVYDISVAGEHEFFANGVLVHNCWRYLVRWKARWFDRGPNPPKGIIIKTPDMSFEEQKRIRSERIAMQAQQARRRRR